MHWICRCPAFFISHFLICKHLIQAKGDVDVQFFDQVCCHYQYPFVSISSTSINNFKISVITSEVFKGNDLFEDIDSQFCEELSERLINTTEKVLEILKGNTVF